MSTENIFEEIKAIVAEELGVETSTLTMDSSFKDDLDADSLSLFQIVNDLEDKFDIQIEETGDISTIGDVVKLVQDKSK